MSESTQNDPPNQAKRRLMEACRSKDTSLRLAWAITIGEAILLGISAVALMDYWLMLPVSIRSAGAMVLLALAGFGIFRMVKFIRKPTQLKEAALDVEAQRPQLGCEISTAAEYLSGERQTAREYEPELVSALEAQAAVDLSGARIPYKHRLLRPGFLLFLTLLTLLVLVVAAPVALTALKRAAFPFSQARYTQVQVTPGTAVVPIGQDLEVTNIFLGRPPKDPQFHWQQEGDVKWQSIPLTSQSSDGAFLHTVKNLQTSFKYRVTGNDAVSEDYQVEAYVPPAVKELDVRVSQPTYTRQPAVDQKSPDISALRSSTVQVRVEPTVKLASAKIRFSAVPGEVPLQPDGQGAWTANLAISKDTDYWIELADEKGRPGTNAEPYHIKALADAPPTVEIGDPGQDSHSSATNKLPVKISVADDFGVEEIKVVFHKLGGAAQTVAATRERDENGEITATAELDLSVLGLKEFEVVAYHAEAKDNNTLDGPGLGKSPVYFVEITNLETMSSKQPPAMPAQKANLLVIQKQIIADTTALPLKASEEKFVELAARQGDAKDFGQIYLDALTLGAAPTEAVGEMQSALRDMETAQSHLDSRKQTDALPPEESALAHLYQVLKLMPELASMPTQPPPPPKPQEQKPPPTNQLAVVLEAIKEKKKEEADNAAIEEALEQAQSLAQAQASLNLALRHPEHAEGKALAPAQGQGQGQGQGKPQDQESPKAESSEPGKETANAEGKDQEKENAQADPEAKPKEKSKDTQLAKAAKSESKTPGKGKGKGKKQANDAQAKAQAAKAQAKADAQGKGKGEGKGQGEGEGKGQGKGKGKGQGQGQGEGEPELAQEQPPQEKPEELPPQEAAQLAQKEAALSKQAQALAEKLERLAGNDKRVGHNAGQKAKLGGQKIASATEELKKGNFGSAGVHGFQGELALREVAAHLERILRDVPEFTDVASEDAPKEYEGLISEYFKKLSHAE